MGICESQVRGLYHYRYLPLLACHERQQLERLKGMSEQAGLILTLDELAPEGGEPQLWLVRELRSGATLRCGWMNQQDQAAFAAFLRPIADLDLPISAVLNDKQSGLLPAVAEVFPQAKHALCQIHYLRNAAAPVAEADEAMKVRLRQEIREAIGEWIRQEKGEEQGVLTVTGMLPSPVETPPMAQATSSMEETDARREAIVRDICRRIRYLLTLKGNPPLRLAGLEMFARLREVEQCIDRLIVHHATPQLLALQQGLHASLNSVQATYEMVRKAGNWLEQIANLLNPEGKPLRSGYQVRQDLFTLLDQIQRTRTLDPFLRSSFDSIQKTTLNYAPALFHCYDLPGLPRTNNDRESEFRDLYRRLLRTTGQRGLTRRIIQREALGNFCLAQKLCRILSKPSHKSLTKTTKPNISACFNIGSVLDSILVRRNNLRPSSSGWYKTGPLYPLIAHSNLCGIALICDSIPYLVGTKGLEPPTSCVYM
jgi:hypothetical protein